MLNADSSDGDEGLVRHWLVVVSIGDEVTILEGGEFLKVAPDTNSIRSAWSKTWLDESKRLNEDSTWALIVMFVCFVWSRVQALWVALSGIPTMRFVLLIPSAPPINITMDYGI